jgi:hypothetical protein
MSRTQYSYNSISRGVSLLMDGGRPYTFEGVLWRPPGIHALGVNNRLDEIYRFGIGSASIQNRTGGVIACGVGGRVHRSEWVAGQWVQGSTTYTDDTVDAQDAGSNDFPLETLTANDGFLVAARNPFNCLDIDVGTAAVGTGPVRTIEYSLSGGSWSTLSNVLVHTVAAAHYAVGETIIMWHIPGDWAPLEAPHGTNVPLGLYGMRFRSTTPPGTTAGVANSMSVAKIVLAIESLIDNALYTISPLGEIYLEGGYDSLVAVLSSKAAIQSMVHVEGRVA